MFFGCQLALDRRRPDSRAVAGTVYRSGPVAL